MPIRLNARDLATRARTLAAATSRWAPVVDFDPITRYYALLESTDDHEAWLLTWLPGQGTVWHDHGDSAGSFVVVRGALFEQTALPSDPTTGERRAAPGRSIGTGDQRTFGRGYVHRVTNVTTDPAISLHVYGPRLTAMNTWAPEATGSETVLVPAGTERAGVSW